MKIENFPKFLLLVFFVALFLRVFNLTNLPAGFQADEVRAGWNAYSILKTGLDDRGNRLALYYNTFGDYRPTGIFYITIPSILLFGLNEFSTRFPSALFGALTIVPVYFLAKEFFRKNPKEAEFIAYFSSLLLALSPWHILVSRSTSEVVISTFLALVGLFYLIHAFNNESGKNYFLSFLLFLISYLFYHTVRLLAPIFIFITIIYYWKLLSSKGKKFATMFFTTILLLTSSFMINKASLGRLSQVSLTKNVDVLKELDTQKVYLNRDFIFDHKYIIFSKHVVSEYISYFSGDFLIGDTAKPIRYRTPSVGVITLAEFLILLIGFYYLIKNRDFNLPILLLFASPIAAAITIEDSPNLHRSMFMVIFLTMIMAYALANLLRGKLTQRFSLLILIGFFVLNLNYFWLSYRTRSTQHIAHVRNYSHKDLVLYLNEVHNDYERVVITNDPDDPYPWFAFFNKLDPAEFNKYAITRTKGDWNYTNITFSQKECPSGDIFPGPRDKPIQENILVIDGFKCPVESKLKDGMQAKVIKQFFLPDGKIAFTLWEKN